VDIAGQDIPKSPTRDRICSVSVDLDPVACYHRIHALADPPAEKARVAVLRRCLPRFAELFARHGVRATLFVVGSDLGDDPEGRALLAALARDGHELASHTHTHPYDFVRLTEARIGEEIDRAHDAIGACTGVAPVGFRAPGYEVSAAVLTALAARHYRYDSSAFPSAPYYGAKALVMAAMRVLGRPSGSILGSPRALLAPRAPYRPSLVAPYRRGDAALVELPIAVTPLARLPVIGTSLVTAPAWLRRHLVAAALRAPFFNLELHGIDLADADADEISPALIARQPDLRRSLAHKREALEQTLTAARAAGFRFAPLAEVAARH
jgi:peptidoglycan/xylan/chitin deacetylase (PgdA/CDA1 family)